MNKDAFIPLYLNNDLADKLYTIAVNVFIQSKSVSAKNLISIAINTPLSELTYDTFGKYMQGDLHVQMSNELTKQNTQERISIQILILLELMDILDSNSVLKKIDSEEAIDNIKENDYVELSGILNLNPTIQYFENIVKLMELDYIFNLNSEIKQDRIELLKNKLNEIKKFNCIKYIVTDICNTKTCAAIPILNNYLGDNLNYALDSNVRILGKVIKRIDREEKNKINLCTGTCFDFIGEEHISDMGNTFLRGINRLDRYYDRIKKEDYNPTIEIVPIAIYV